MSTVAITNLGVRVWTRKSDLPQGNFLHSLTQPKIARQITFELIDIEYDRMKDEISRIKHVEYNTTIGINVINVDDIEDFANI